MVKRKMDTDPFFEVVSLGIITEAEAMLRKDPQLVHASDETKTTPLAFACSKEMKSLLIEYGANVNAQNNLGRTPLHATAFCYDDSNDATELLLSNGADISARDNRGWTPLCLAADNGNLVTVESLVTHGADINAVDNEGKTVLQIAIEDDGPNSTKIASFLVNNGAQIQKIDQAIAVGDLSWVESYLKTNPELIDRKDSYGSTPLQWAIDYGQLDIAKFLVLNGADVNVRDIIDRTPLHYVESSNVYYLSPELGYETAEFLLSNGADINVRDNKGHTPLALALKNKNKNIADLLRKHGAKE